ncbi:alpha/beta hydrolase family protein [Thalassotalea sediminis]|uniref:alpha/beta hydrolase family protein n=1 Tax=Thalassotalea sediminis TaxID=1759089 RepID=UPI002572FDB3|nr:alpha/beta hydrolase [Thalassotalea sediminis]
MARVQSSAVELTHVIAAQDVQLAGTLTLPSESKENALVIMLSGSGPQDRDETLDGFKVFKTLSDQLSERGITTFRFDDRGVGKSTGNFASSTLQDHVNDVVAIMEYFKNHETHRFDDFILLGHSQGGIVSAKVAVQYNDVNKVILMGAPAVPLIEIVTYQLRQEYEQKKLDRAVIEKDVSVHNKLMHAIYSQQGIKQALKQFTASSILMLLANNQNEKDLAEITQLAEERTKQYEVVYALPSLTSFLYHDTAKDYEKLSIPVLGLFGGKDLQVTIAQNKDRMENALLKSKTRYQFETFNDANHYFQQADTGLREEYATLEKHFVDGFVDTLSNWILTQ